MISVKGSLSGHTKCGNPGGTAVFFIVPEAYHCFRAFYLFFQKGGYCYENSKNCRCDT